MKRVLSAVAVCLGLLSAAFAADDINEVAAAVAANLKTKQGTFSASATLLPVYGEDGTPSRYFIGFRFAPNAAKKFKGAVRLVELE